MGAEACQSFCPFFVMEKLRSIKQKKNCYLIDMKKLRKKALKTAKKQTFTAPKTAKSKRLRNFFR
jgi:uncharacterized protein YutD